MPVCTLDNPNLASIEEVYNVIGKACKLGIVWQADDYESAKRGIGIEKVTPFMLGVVITGSSYHVRSAEPIWVSIQDKYSLDRQRAKESRVPKLRVGGDSDILTQEVVELVQKELGLTLASQS